MLTLIAAGFGRTFAAAVALGEGQTFGRSAALACLLPPVKTSTIWSVPQPASPRATTAAVTERTSLRRWRGRRMRGYVLPVMRYFPPMPGGVSMLMGAA